MRRRLLGLLVALVAGSAAGGEAPRGPTPHALTKAEIGTRLRIFAKEGDFALSNGAITAVVRKKDGWLTELWRNRAVLPTSEQLGTLTDVDGIWQVHPIVRQGDKRVAVLASRIAALADGIEVEGSAELGGVRYRAVTVHRLHPTAPRLVMTTTFSVEGGGPAGAVEFGDEIKWGNTPYYVEGIGKPRLKFSGHARWVGRHGAGGDLMLRPVGKEQLYVTYESASKFFGFQGALAALYARKGIPPGQSVTFSRELVFEPVPVPRQQPPKDAGQLVIEVKDENDAPIAAKARLSRPGRDDPLFAYDGGLDGADHFVWTGNGRIERALAPGQYKLLVTAGVERDAVSRSVEIEPGKTARVQARLPRVIPTPGWISADLHLHQAPSVDADVGLPERVVAIAAEGVELGVATDHYVVTDLAPTVRFLKDRGVLTSDVQTVAGCEVSTLGRRFGHFNVFPLRTDQRLEAVDTMPSALFADARKKSPSGVLQVNHPRWAPHLGYFTYFNLDPNSGEAGTAGYDPNFDTLEVYNGDDAFDLRKVKQVFADWLHLLGRGRRYTATGSSDSHNLAFLDPGLPRTLIRWGKGSSDAEDVKAPPAAIIAALKAGRAIVTSGPIIDATIGSAGPGETARGVGSKARLRVVVRAAPWVDVRAVEIYQGGSGKRLEWVQIPKKSAVLRLERVFDLPVSGPTFFVVAAQGERGLPNASRPGTVPFAFTNPIWVEP